MDSNGFNGLKSQDHGGASGKGIGLLHRIKRFPF
jgi:hypothetical protein